MSKIELLHGDCLELMKDIPDGSIDMILTDPPYGTTACKWDSVIPFDKMWKQLNRVIKNNGAILLFGSEPFSSLLRCSNLKNYKYDWIWNKVKPGNILFSKHKPLQNHENISVFNSKIYFPIMESCGYRTSRIYSKSKSINHKYNINDIYEYKDGKFPKTILTFSNANQKDRLHPTQKPVPLLEYLIKTYTKENETVLDFTMGSGSTGVACKNLNRNFIGMEIDKKYFDIAKQRIENGFVQEKINDADLDKFALFQ